MYSIRFWIFVDRVRLTEGGREIEEESLTRAKAVGAVEVFAMNLEFFSSIFSLLDSEQSNCYPGLQV